MSLTYRLFTISIGDVSTRPVTSGLAVITPSQQLTDATDGITVGAPVVINFGQGPPSVLLLTTDNANVQPAGQWYYNITFIGMPQGTVFQSQSFEFPYGPGTPLDFSAITQVTPGPAYSPFAPINNPVFGGTPEGPTAEPLTDSAQLATTAYSDAATTVEKNRAETAEALAHLNPVFLSAAATYNASLNDLAISNCTSGNSVVNLPHAPAGGSIVSVKLGFQNTPTGSQGLYYTQVNAQGGDTFETSTGGTSVKMALLAESSTWQYNSAAHAWVRQWGVLSWTNIQNNMPAVINVVGQGADPSGAADSTTAFNAAILAITGAATGIRTDTGVTVTSGSAVVQDASAISGDSGKAITGTGIPPSTVISTVTPGTGYTISNNATLNGTSVQVGSVVGRTVTGAVYIPPGTFKLTSDLIIRGVVGFHLIGAGPGQTHLLPHGTAFTQALLFIDGSKDSVFEGFTIQGDTTEQVTDAIRLDFTSATNTGSSANMFRDIRLKATNCVIGISAEGNGAAQLDGTQFHNVVLAGKQAGSGSWSSSGNSQKAIALGNGTFGNNYDHNLVGVSWAEFYYGIYCNASGFNLTSSQPGANFCEFWIMPGAQCSITNVQSQDSAQFLIQTGFSPYAVSFRDCEMQTLYPANTSPYTLVNISGGTCIFDGFTGWVQQSSLYVTPNFTISGAATARASHVTLRNLSLQGAKTSVITPSGSNPVELVVENYQNWSTTTAQSVPPVAGDLLSVYTGGAWINLDAAPPTITDPQVNFYTSTSSWTKPAGAQTVFVAVLAGGGGGGSGSSGASGTAQVGGGGGAGAYLATRQFVAADLPGTAITATVGAGGNGGAAVTGTSGTTSGLGGSGGGISKFGNYLESNAAASGFGGLQSGANGLGGSSFAGVTSVLLGGGAAASTTGAAGVGTNPAALAAPGGPSGAGIPAAGTPAENGSAGNVSLLAADAAGGTAGVAGGASPGQGVASALANGSCGPAPGSGASSITGAAQNGASALANSGAGGAGGGAALNGSASGAGGSGGSGWVLVITYFQ